MFAIEKAFNDESLGIYERYIVAGVYAVLLMVTLLMIVYFLRFLLIWVFRGVNVFFTYIKESLNNPKSLPHIGGLILLKSVPWYFSLLIMILFFCGMCALITNSQIRSESFKYILGATVGSLIGVVKKQEESEFEESLLEAAAEQTKSQDSDPEKS